MKAAAKLLTLCFCLSIVFLSYQSGASPSPVKPEVSKEKWEYYASDEEGTAYSYNSNSIKRLKGGIVRVWLHAIYSEKHPNYSEGKSQWEIDCTKKSLRGITAQTKKKDGTSVDITKPSDWSAIPPESTAETLYETLCKKKGAKTP